MDFGKTNEGQDWTIVQRSIYFFTDFNDAPTLSGTVYRVQKTITKNSLGQIKTTTGSKKVVSYNRIAFEALTGLSYSEFAAAVRTTFEIVSVSNATHVTSIAMEITSNAENKYRGTFMVNGEPATAASGLITSYGKQWPGFVFMWRLYNDQPTTPNATGASAQAGFAAADDNEITILAGTEDKYDAGLRTFTFNESNPNNAQLIAYAECLPATGKQENWGSVIYPETGLIENWQ